MIKTVSVEEAKELLRTHENDPNFVIMDVRTKEEFEEKHHPKALHLDFYAPAFEEELTKLHRSKTYLIHCQTGGRARHALYLMENLGFQDIFMVKGILLAE